MDKKYILEKLKEIDKNEFGFKRIGLFGSYSKDEQTENSDIDIFVELEFKKGMYRNYCNLQDYLEKLFNKKVDLLEEGHFEYDYKVPAVKEYKEKLRKEILESVIYV